MAALLEVRNLSVRYGKVEAVHDVSIEAGGNELMVQRTAIVQVLPKGTIK